jgi:hypothetical protein
MKNMTVEQIEKAYSGRRQSSGGTLLDEVASLSKGDPLKFDSFLKKTRYEMWLIALGGS